MRRLSRRTILSASALGGAAAFGAPGFLRRALAQEPGRSPKRLVVLFMPNCSVRDRWVSTGGRNVDTATGTATEYTLNQLTQPLLPIMPHTTLVHGISMAAMKGDLHSSAQIRVTTGGDVIMPNEGGGGGNLPSGPSFDTLAAEQSPIIKGGDTKFKQLVLSADTRGSSLHHRCVSSDMNSAFIPPENQPQTVFARLFSDASTIGAAAGASAEERAAAFERLRLRKKSVLDLISRDLTRLQKRVPSAQRATLQSHLTAVESLEKTIMNQTAGNSAAANAALPTVGMLTPNNSAAHPNLMKAFFDIIRTSMQLDLTRVASMAFGTGNSNVSFADFAAGPAGGVHNISHQSKNVATMDKLTTITLWYNARVTEFAQSLAAIPEGDGTMLDNTLIVLYSEVGQWHEHNDIPIALIGGRNLGNVGNRVLRYNRQVNDVGAAILTRLQVPITTFGDARWYRGPAPELLV